ncbi:MAG: hypothetical protein AAFV33_09915 [Chloroflexota bacterium]
MENYREEMLAQLKKRPPEFLDLAMARLIREEIAAIQFGLKMLESPQNANDTLISFDQFSRGLEEAIHSIEDVLSASLHREENDPDT